MIRIRPYRPDDLPHLWLINQAGVPGVSEESAATLGRWIALSETLVAVRDDDLPLGFITLVPPGTAQYPSENLRWFEARGSNLIYVDRIAVTEFARGQRLGEALYGAAFALFAPRYEKIGCEVNRCPPNPGSLRFHRRLGFEEVGENIFVSGQKEVIYLERTI